MDTLTERTAEESSAVAPALASYMATRDKRIAKFWPHYPAYITGLFEELMARGSVKVGGRSTCGGSDPTLTALRCWNEVVRKARSFGYAITEETCQGQRNAWATRGGGFWSESEYRLAKDHTR